jgi:hypothetical protein
MNVVHDYESLGYINWHRVRPELLETYSGTSIVAWHGKIEGQLKNLLNDAEKGRNYPYADKIREFLKIWRANEITGSINREILETLKAAADMLSVDNWNLSSYFSSLRDALKVLLASEEELPRDADMNQNDPYAGGGGGGGGPPMSPSFGPEGEPGGGMEGGGGGAGGAGGGAPGEIPAEGEQGPAGAGGPEGGPTAIPPGEPEAAGGEAGAPTPEEAGGEGIGPEDMPDKDRFGEL